MSIFSKLDEVVRRFEILSERLADPSIYDRQKEFKEISSERAQLLLVVEAYKNYKQLKADIEGAKDILKSESDPDLREMAKAEVQEKEALLESSEKELQILLLPKDPLDDKNVIIEIRAGAGGDEASIFVADVYRMYQNYLKGLGFKIEQISVSEGDQGIKEVIFSVAGDQVYSRLKYESGVHRVQRVPKTEAQGRIHTSTITVAVLPEAEDVEVELNMNDVRVDVYRSGGAGGQSVNTTDSAVRLTHMPTGIVIAMQDERSQLKNKDKAFKILKAKLYDLKVSEQQSQEASMRKGQVGTGDRSERIRTYNFPQGRLTDHRIGLTLYNLDSIINGDLGEVIDALVTYYQAELLKGDDDLIQQKDS